MLQSSISHFLKHNKKSHPIKLKKDRMALGIEYEKEKLFKSLSKKAFTISDFSIIIIKKID